MEAAITEQQKIFVKRSGNMDANKVGFYLISMPADKIATVCVMHLMKVLLAEFTQSDKEADISA